MPHHRTDRWDPDHWETGDLVRRTLQALDIAARTVRAAIGADDSTLTSLTSDRGPTGSRSEAPPLVLSKVLAETAMLLRCAAPIRALDLRIDATIDEVARLVVRNARGDDLLAALCLEPGLALDHAFTHIQLRDLGYPDAQVDRLLAETLQTAPVGGPERLPHRELEQRWLDRIWSGSERDNAGDEVDAELLARSSLGRPLDALGSATDDLYAFTHVVLYASDLGRRPIRLPRPVGDIVADAEAALAASVDADNLDLTAELLWTWPMLGVPWSPAATFGFAILAESQDMHGFLPGPGFSVEHHNSLPRDLRDEYVLKTSYHATLVMGLLCSAALRDGRTPPVEVVAAHRPVGAADSVHTLLQSPQRKRLWQHAFGRLAAGRRESLAPFVLAIALRRARDANDLALVRESLRVGLLLGLVDGPTTRQAVALLRRGTLLGQPGASPSKTTEPFARVSTRSVNTSGRA